MRDPVKYTSTDVAKLAGVSQATVSRVFNQPDTVIESTRARVLAAARQLQYYPNAIAKSLNSDTTGLVGVIVRDMTNPFYTGLIAALMDRLSLKGKKVLLFNGRVTDDIEAVMAEAMSYRVDGLVIASASLSEQLMRKNVPEILPVVLINYHVQSDRFCSIGSDELRNGRLVADRLWGQGCRHFYCFSGPDNMPSSTERLRGFRQRLRELGSEEPVWSYGSYTYDSGLERMEHELPGLPEDRSGIFCGNDLIGMGVLDALRRGGVSVPDRCAVIGFDDIAQSGWEAYRLSSMRFPVEEMIDIAVNYLTGDREHYAGCHRFLCSFVQRQTTPEI